MDFSLYREDGVLYYVCMYIATVPNRNSPPAILLRESYREGRAVKTRTLCNLTPLPPEAVDAIRRVLKGQKLVAAQEAFEIIASPQHGNVQAVFTAMRRLGFPQLIASRPSAERELIQGLVVARILQPDSKLATTRWWHNTTLPSILGLGDATEDDVYRAMDWLLERQPAIERKLAARHLSDGALVLYDLSSSYFEGSTCPLATFGYNRDGKSGKLQVNYGLLTDGEGRPVSVSVFAGNIREAKTLLPEVQKVREQFGLKRLILVGDRGMITEKQIQTLRGLEGVDWIGALRPEAITKLIRAGSVQLGLFDERNLFEVTHPDFPGERLVACRNPDLALRREQKRTTLIEATRLELIRVQRMIEGGRLRGQDAIAARCQAILSHYAIGRHYQLEVRDDGFDYQIDQAALTASDPAGSQAARIQRHQQAIGAQFEKLRGSIQRGRLHGRDRIGLRVGRALNKYKVGKHFKLEIQDDRFDFEVDQDRVAEEAALDGLYVIRTSLGPDRISAEDTVRGYKRLSQVERAFRSLKTVDLHVRPIHHRLEDRVRAHIFLCMLAYYVQWHMLEAWRPLLFSDEDQAAKLTRDPVAPARRSAQALEKARSRQLDDGSPAHDFGTLLALLGGIVRNTCRVQAGGPDTPTFEIVTTANPEQQRALHLLHTIGV
jgi:transposase